MKVKGDVKNIVRFQVNRNIINLYKSFLIMLEDLEYEHQTHFQKLKDKFPDTYHDLLDQADYLTEEKLEHLRKRILDSGNHCAREIAATVEHII